MFIAHGNFVRKNARWIMLAVLALLIPSFILMFTESSKSDRQGGTLPTLRGKPIAAQEFDQMKELVRAQYVVMRGRDLSHTTQMQDQIKQEAVIQMLMLRKAQAMGIRVGDAELQNALVSQPIFLNSAGQFDKEKFGQFLILLNNNSVSEGMFEEVMRRRLLIEKLQQLVTSAIKPTPTEIQQAYLPLHEKVTIDLVPFNVADYKEPITISNAEVQAYYDENKESFRVPAKVKFEYAEFTAAAAKKSVHMTDDEIADFYNRTKYHYADTNGVPQPLTAVKAAVQSDLLDVRANQAAADRAQEFSLKLSQDPKPEFGKLCATFGVAPVVTDYLSAFDKVPGVIGVPDFTARASQLSADMPVSDPLGGSNNYYVIEFIAAQPSLIPPLAQVETNVVAQVKRLHTYIATLQHAQASLDALKKLMASGQTFTQACTQLKLKVETPPPFTVADEKPDLPAAAHIQQASLELPVNGISDLIETPTGGLFFRIRDRHAADLAKFEKDRQAIARQVVQRDRQAVFSDWIQTLVRNEQVDFKIPHRTAESEDASATDATN